MEDYFCVCVFVCVFKNCFKSGRLLELKRKEGQRKVCPHLRCEAILMGPYFKLTVTTYLKFGVHVIE